MQGYHCQKALHRSERHMFAWCGLCRRDALLYHGTLILKGIPFAMAQTHRKWHALQRWTGGKAMSGTCAMHSGVVGLHAGGDGGLTHDGGQVVKLLINIPSHHLACLIRRQVLACQYSQSEDKESLVTHTHPCRSQVRHEGGV